MLTEPGVRELDRDVAESLAARPTDAPRTGPRVRVSGWLRRHRLSIGILAIVLVAVGVVHATGMSRWPGPRDDEGTYVAQAWAVQRFHALSQYTFTYDHPPGGWFLLSLWLWATGGLARHTHAIAAGREFMLVQQVVSSALLYMLCRRLDIRRAFALGAVMLFAFSPLALEFHRAVYLDNLVTPWLLGSFILALSPRKHLAAAIGSAACFAAAVLIKETTLLLLPALAYQLWQQSDRRTRRMAVGLFTAIVGITLMSYPLYALLKGELFPNRGHVTLLGSAWWQLFGREPSGSVFQHGTTANVLVRFWLQSDRWLLLGALVLLPAGFAMRRLRPVAVALALLAVMMLRNGYLPVPYVIAPLMFIPVLFAGVADRVWTLSMSGRALPRAAAAAGIATMVFAGAQAAPAWAKGDRRELHQDGAKEFRSAEQWVAGHVPHDSRIVVDNTFWLDLVRAGFQRDRVIWHEKLDVDPAVTRRLRQGWRSIDYLISTPGIRTETRTRSMPTLETLLKHSRVVRAFGLGDNVTEIRQVLP